MATYRCFFVRADGHIIGVEVADLPDDRAAEDWGHAMLQRWVHDPPAIALEVWQLDRRVCRLRKAGP
jgi:hypothetical protein